MDTTSAMSQQWKDRDSKVFSQKAEVKAKEMKEFTGSPRIDPLSRKIAEIVTQQEIAALGITTKEPTPKKPTFSIPKAIPVQEAPDKKLPVQTDKSKAVKNFADSPTKSPGGITDEPEPNPAPLLTEQSKPDDQENLSNEHRGHSSIPHVIVISDPEIQKEEKKRDDQEEMLHNVEHLQAFQEELQREYPELGLNNDIEGSSFHTNELDELEEACKDLDDEHDKAKGAGETGNHEVVQGEVGNHEAGQGDNAVNEKNIKKEEVKGEGELGKDLLNREVDMLSNKTEYDGSPTLENQHFGDKTIEKQEKNANEKNIVAREKSLKSEKNEARDPAAEKESLTSPQRRTLNQITHTKSQPIMKVKSPKAKEFVNLHNASTKAEFLHGHVENIQKATPRCHINLNNCKSSPIYFSLRVPPDSKVKCESGIGSADSLRRILLRQFLDEDTVPKDFYTKNIEWAQDKEQRLQRIREENKDKDIEGCTFDPYFDKHDSARRKIYSFEYRAAVSPNAKNYDRISEPLSPRVQKNIVKYESLSPTDYYVRYREGVNIERMFQIGKPMVPYRSINLLRKDKA
ncbi:hypothetical protein SteCoe_1822 [Stentor coeruleus]|uniref:Uncharacterized protein n=1 Tax=Stentor coeruleus TaxID=5963 RepID=A0A1R2D164_9CILI|nr:hypothetical protein SteCoe_1822 [Stentor coeruleus]